MNEPTNTTGQPAHHHHESTYALLMSSEEKGRNIFEIVIYPLLILGPLLAIWQFAQQPVNIPVAGLDGARCVVCDAWVQNTVCQHPAIKG